MTRRLVAEGMGTAFLLAVVVGSGIMAERLSGGNVALALLGATAATLVFCWLYPAAPKDSTVAGTVAPGEFASR